MDWSCRDIVLYDDDGRAIYNGPRFLRCAYPECAELMTHGKLEANQGLCTCGGRKYRPSLKIKAEEQEAILMGQIPLLKWERELLEGKLEEVKLDQS